MKIVMDEKSTEMSPSVDLSETVSCAEYGKVLCELLRNSSSDLIDYRVLDVNAKFADQVQLTRESILSKEGSSLSSPCEHALFLKRAKEAIESGEPRVWEGYIASVERTFRIVVDPLGANHLALLLYDVPEGSREKGLEKKVEDKTAFMEGLMGAIPDAVVYVFDLRTRQNVYVSEGIQSVLGYTPCAFKKTVDASFETLFHPEDLPLIEEHFKELERMEGKGSMELVYRIKHQRGHWVWVEHRDTVFAWEEGKPLQTIGIVVDVTERKREQEQQKKRKESFEEFPDRFPGAIFQLRVHPDGSSCFPFFSEAIYDLYEVVPEELEIDSDGIFSRTHPEDQVRLRNSLKRSFLRQSLWEEDYRVVLPTKGVRWMRGAAKPEKLSCGSVLWSGYVHDVTELREAIRKKEEGDRWYKALVTNVPGAIFRCLLDEDWTMEYISDKIVEITGYDPSAFACHPTQSYSLMIVEKDRARVKKKIEESRKKGTPYSIDYRILHADTTTRCIREHGQVFQFEDQCQIYGVLSDVTKEKKRAQELKESKERFRQITETISEVFWLRCEETGEILYVNPAYEEIWGRSCEELYINPESYMEGFHEEDRLQVQEAIKSHKPSEAFQIQHRIRQPGGAVRWVEARMFPVWDEKGRIIRRVGAAKDITLQKLTEEALCASKEHYQRIAENAQVGLFQLELFPEETYRFVYCSTKFREITGISHEEAPKEYTVLLQKIHPAYQESFELSLKESGQNLIEFHQVFLYQREEEDVWLEVRAHPEPFTGGVLWDGVLVDIDKVKRAEDALAKERDRLCNILEGANVGTWEYNLQTGQAFVNDKWEEILGYSVEELGPLSMDTFLHFLHPEDQVAARAVYEQYLAGSEEDYEACFRIRHLDGTYRFMQAKGKVRSRTKEGRPLWMFGVAMDVTAQKKAEETLLESKEWFRALYENSPVSISILDPHTGGIVSANTAMYQAYGVDSIEEINARREEGIPPYSREDALCWTRKTVSEGPQVFDWKRNILEDSETYLKVHLSPIQLTNNQRVLATAMDITDQKQAEAKLAEYAMDIEMASMERERLYEALHTEMQSAREAYRRLVEQQLPVLDTMSLSVVHNPATFMGGDFSYVIQKGDYLVLCISDITGHGLEGTMFGLFVKTSIASYVELVSHPTPREILSFLDKQVRTAGYPSEYAVAIFVLVLNLRTYEASFSAAGFQNPPVLVVSEGITEMLVSTGLPISPDIPQSLVDFEQQWIVLPQDALLFLATDGIYEQTKGEDSYEERLLDLIPSCLGLSADSAAEVIWQDFLCFLEEEEQRDDVSFLILLT